MVIWTSACTWHPRAAVRHGVGGGGGAPPQGSHGREGPDRPGDRGHRPPPGRHARPPLQVSLHLLHGVTVGPRQVYWVDTHLDTIERCDYQGRGRTTVARGLAHNLSVGSQSATAKFPSIPQAWTGGLPEPAPLLLLAAELDREDGEAAADQLLHPGVRPGAPHRHPGLSQVPDRVGGYFKE